MLLELGPCPVEDVMRWSKFVRRILVEIRSTPDYDQMISPDVVELWSRTVDDWAGHAEVTAGRPDEPFRWSGLLEPEVVEFLLDGLDRCVNSPLVMSWVTPQDAEEQRAFTTVVIRAFVDSLNAEGRSCRHYVDQVLVSLGGLLED